MSNYEEMLKAAYEKLPKRTEEASRFVLPEVQIQPTGLKTTIVNFVDIAQAMRRDPNHLMKFLVKELATSGELEGKRLVVIGKFFKQAVDKKIELYLKKYVYCPECGKPDSKLEKEDRFLFLKCEVCGARSSVSL